MDKLKKLLCCLWSTPTAILIATILYLYADRHEIVYLSGENVTGGVFLVTNKWTGKTCFTSLSDREMGNDYATWNYNRFASCKVTDSYLLDGKD